MQVFHFKHWINYLLILFCFQIDAKENTFSKPNVILILADDMGYGDLSCYGQTKFKTPNIDKLAADGILFTQHYSGATICAPSRAALLTAKHTGHTTIRGNKRVSKYSDFPLSNTDTILTQIFKQAGYTTGVFGKWGVGGVDDIFSKGIDKFVGYFSQLRAHNYYPKVLWNNQEQIHFSENKSFKQQTYAPNVIHDSLMAFIDRNKNQPFFIYMPTIIPHAELAPPYSIIKDNIGKYDTEKKFRGIKTIKIAKKFGAYSKQKNPKAAFASMIMLLDKQVGEIVMKLKEKNIYDNTIIIFTSDNGPHKEGGADPDYFNSSGGLSGYKRDVYEGGIRVPLIVHCPAYFVSDRSDLISASWDILPTLKNILNVKYSSDNDGISFLPTLQNKIANQQQHSFLYWEFHGNGGQQAIRIGNWKLIRLNIQHPSKMKLELYNLKEDEKETKNLANQYPELVKEFSKRMSEVRTPSKDFPLKIDKYKKQNK